MILVLLFMALCFAPPLLALAAFVIDECMRGGGGGGGEYWGWDE